MSVVSIGALNKKKVNDLSLFLVADKPDIALSLDNELEGVNITSFSSLGHEQKQFFYLIHHANVLVYSVGALGFEITLNNLKRVRSQATALTILVVDTEPTPKRAVQAMKAGANDYLPHNGEKSELLAFVEQACMDLSDKPQHLLSSPRRETYHQSAPSYPTVNDKIHHLAKAAGYLATCNNLEEVCEGLLKSLGEALGVTGGSLYLKENNALRKMHSLDPGHAPACIYFPLEKGTIFEEVYSTGKAVLVTDEADIQAHKLSGWSGYEANNLFVYPIVQKNGETIGILSLHGKREEDFSSEDRDLVLILASYSNETICALLAHEKSTKSLESLQLTFENMNQGIILLNENGNIVHYNQKLLTITRLLEAQISVGHNISELLCVFRERGDLEQNYQDACFWTLLDDNGEYLMNCTSGVMVRISGNHIPEGGYVVTFTDTTKQKEWENKLYQAKEKAEAANVSKTNFLANVSHELRTPLNAIIGFAEMINKEVFGPLDNQRYNEYVKHIYESGSHLLRLINNLLDMSKVEAGKFVREDGDVNLSDLIKNTMMYFSGQAKDSQINLTLEENVKLGIIQADENALRQILLNLLSNALKFTPKGGEVTVIVDQAENDYLRITVQDTGIGIDEKLISVALQPFGQIENTFNRKYPGTGLGLPLVVSLTELHGGQFDIQSALGDGTKCSISIPVVH